jgi:hypothetical protein
VKVEHERSRIRRGRGNVEECVALGPQIQGSDTGLGAASRGWDRAGAQPNSGFGARTGRQECSEEDAASRHLGFRRSESENAPDFLPAHPGRA